MSNNLSKYLHQPLLGDLFISWLLALMITTHTICQSIEHFCLYKFGFASRVYPNSWRESWVGIIALPWLFSTSRRGYRHMLTNMPTSCSVDAQWSPYQNCLDLKSRIYDNLFLKYQIPGREALMVPQCCVPHHKSIYTLWLISSHWCKSIHNVSLDS